MARQQAPIEVNTFVGGLVTDAGPLTFPDNASLDEDNMVLNNDGSRNRRLGMDSEAGGSTITTGVTFSASNDYGHTTYRWENAGNDSSVSLLVVQFGEEIKFFNLNNSIISSEVIHTHMFATSTSETAFSYATVDGILTVATGQSSITSFEYDTGTNTITGSFDTLKIRDLFGVEDIISSVNLKVGNNISLRPSGIDDEHLYNLRNQTWSEPRYASNTETNTDTISHFFSTASVYPSNADQVNKALYADANDTNNRTVDRFFAKDLEVNRFGSTHAPVGHYIIDALDRGASREAAYTTTIDQNSAITMLTLSGSLPVDRTEGGASVITQYAGRVWYAGFEGAVTGGDTKSPRMSSYVLFSKRINDISDITVCHQDGDPTSLDEPDLLDTDGGFIRIDEAFGIKALVTLGQSLMVVATNGVWAITGLDKGGFTATGYSVNKITDRGAEGAKSVVEVSGSLAYWGNDAIWSIEKNEFGDWISNNLTNNKIQSLYQAIGNESVLNVQGHFDSYDNKIRWIYDNHIHGTTNVRELVLDRNLGAFYTNTIFSPSQELPKVVGIFASNPYNVALTETEVTADGVLVEADGVQVVVNVSQRTSSTKEIQYVIVNGTASVITYTFGVFRDVDFLDHKSFDATGTDAPAFLLTGYLSGGDFQHQKGLTNLTAYMRKTEDGFNLVGDDLVPTNQSSVSFQTQWSWTNDANSNRFSRVFEAYRQSRAYFPTDVTDTFNDGHTVVQTRNKIRGQGKVLSMRWSTSPGKNFHLYGWSLNLIATTVT